jgi:REP-associated tyrosine transposase
MKPAIITILCCLEPPAPNLARGMRHLKGVYTQRCNRRHGRVGHVLQGRDKAIVVQQDGHLVALGRYVVVNPVRAGLVAKVGEWPWSSYPRHGRPPSPSSLVDGRMAVGAVEPLSTARRPRLSTVPQLTVEAA